MVKIASHIMNPGRMVQFLVPGAKILVENRASPHRKLDYSLLYVVHPKSLILIDSQVPNAIVAEGLHQKKIREFLHVRKVERERAYGENMKSKIDFLLDSHVYLEVKATNYIEDSIGYFPDAPTKRGQRHLRELIQLRRESPKMECAVLFLAQRADIQEIRPFDAIDPTFGQLLRQAAKAGVKLLGYGIAIQNGGKEATLGNPLPLNLRTN